MSAAPGRVRGRRPNRRSHAPWHEPRRVRRLDRVPSTGVRRGSDQAPIPTPLGAPNAADAPFCSEIDIRINYSRPERYTGTISPSKGLERHSEWFCSDLPGVATGPVAQPQRRERGEGIGQVFVEHAQALQDCERHDRDRVATTAFALDRYPGPAG